jgi:hypothetical protein
MAGTMRHIQLKIHTAGVIAPREIGVKVGSRNACGIRLKFFHPAGDFPLDSHPLTSA